VPLQLPLQLLNTMCLPNYVAPQARKVGRRERRKKARPKLDAFLKGAVAAHRESQSRVNPTRALSVIASCHYIVHKTVKTHRDTSPTHSKLECCYYKELISPYCCYRCPSCLLFLKSIKFAHCSLLFSAQNGTLEQDHHRHRSGYEFFSSLNSLV
jgi:hypothetical protein